MFNFLFPAMEEFSLKGRMELKGRLFWFVTLLGLPLWVSLTIYFINKFFERREMQEERIFLKHFSWIDISLIPYLTIGVIMTLFVIFLFKRKISTFLLKKKNEIESDEYVRGAKLVCNDDFNEQFAEYDDFIEINVIDEQCTRKF